MKVRRLSLPTSLPRLDSNSRRDQPVTEMTLAEWRRVLQINLDGVFLGTKYAIRAMQSGNGGTMWHCLLACQPLISAVSICSTRLCHSDVVVVSKPFPMMSKLHKVRKSGPCLIV